MRHRLAIAVAMLLAGCSDGGAAATTAGTTTVATTTTVVTTSTAAATTTSAAAATTTTTVPEPTPFPTDGLGPPCVPEACDVETVAAWGYADYDYQGRRGVVGLLTVEHVEGRDDRGEDFDQDEGLMAGVLLGLQVTPLDFGTGQRATVMELTFYLGDHPVTGEPITAEFVDMAYSADTWHEIGVDLEFPGTEQDRFGYAHPVGNCNRIPQQECPRRESRSAFVALDEMLGYLVVGRAYAFQVVIQQTPPPDERVCDPALDALCAWAEDNLPSGGAMRSYAKALVAAMQGTGAPPGDGLTTSLSLHMFDPIPPAVAGVWMVVEPDCVLCDQVLAAFRHAAPDLPVYAVAVDSPWPQAAGIQVVPSVWVFDSGGAQFGHYEGEDALTRVPAIAATACGLVGCTVVDTGSSTTTTLPADWYQSCEKALGVLIEDAHTAMREVGALTRASENAQAGTDPWTGVADRARTWLIPALEELQASAETVLAADPDTVSQVAATWFRDAATALLDQAEDLVARVIDPDSGIVDAAVWDAWWDVWSQTIQDFNDLLSRAPATARSCPD